jgi:hypothetical protein
LGFTIIQWLCALGCFFGELLMAERLSQMFGSGRVPNNIEGWIWEVLAAAFAFIVFPYNFTYQIVCNDDKRRFCIRVWWTCVIPFVLGFLFLKS